MNNKIDKVHMKYARSHEWIRLNGPHARVGVSARAQKELGEIVYVELPKVGQEVQAGSEVAILESTKAAADIYCPVSGKVTQINETLQQDISLLNDFPESKGWLFELKVYNVSEIDQLLDQVAYQALIEPSPG